MLQPSQFFCYSTSLGHHGALFSRELSRLLKGNVSWECCDRPLRFYSQFLRNQWRHLHSSKTIEARRGLLRGYLRVAAQGRAHRTVEPLHGSNQDANLPSLLGTSMNPASLFCVNPPSRTCHRCASTWGHVRYACLKVKSLTSSV